MANDLKTSSNRDIGFHLRGQVIPPGGKRYGLVIGIESHADSRLDLRCARADAQAIYNLMIDPACGLFPVENVFLLLDAQATRQNIWKALATLRRMCGPDDTVWIYYAGHGAPEGDDFYWVTYDADVNDLFASALSNADLQRALTGLKARRLVTYLDCCHAAAMAAMGHPRRDLLPPDMVINAFHGKGRVTFCSSDGAEKSVELPERGHGAFTYFLDLGLRGAADDTGQGVVTVEKLWDYLRDKVARESRAIGCPQTPKFKCDITHDLPLTLNKAVTENNRRIAEAIDALIGRGDSRLTTDEAEYCHELLRRDARTNDERGVIEHFLPLAEGTLPPHTFKLLVNAARRLRKSESPDSRRTMAPQAGIPRSSHPLRGVIGLIAVLFLVMAIIYAMKTFAPKSASTLTAPAASDSSPTPSATRSVDPAPASPHSTITLVATSRQSTLALTPASAPSVVPTRAPKPASNPTTTVFDAFSSPPGPKPSLNVISATRPTAVGTILLVPSSPGAGPSSRPSTANPPKVAIALAPAPAPAAATSDAAKPKPRLILPTIVGVLRMVFPERPRTATPTSSPSLTTTQAANETSAVGIPAELKPPTSKPTTFPTSTKVAAGAPASRWASVVAPTAASAVLPAARPRSTPSASLMSTPKALTAPPTQPAPIVNREPFVNLIGMRFVSIPAGEFEMGSPVTEVGRSRDEINHHVRLTKGLWMQTTPVTQSQYWSIMEHNNPSRFQAPRLNAPSWNRPVENVSWGDAVGFCRQLSQQTGKHYRLPTEAEWEYACRAGTRTAYWFGEDASTISQHAWCSGNSFNCTHPVGEKGPNPWGLCDMEGNVLQWCSDWYGGLSADDAVDPSGLSFGASRVLRGGSWCSNPPSSGRSASRDTNPPDYQGNYVGFRVVLDSP